MSSLVHRLDRTLYPAYEDNWDNRRFRDWVLTRVDRGDAMLDFGAGRGALAEMSFKGSVRAVAGVDPDPAVLRNPFLDEAAILLLPEGRIPHPDGSFDVVVSNNVLEHLPAPAASFAEVARVLKPGGRFLAKTPNRRHYVALLARLTPTFVHRFVNERRGRRAEDTFPTRYRANTRGALERWGKGAGLELTEFEAWEGRPEYCRLNPVLYLAGFCYERLVNRFAALSGFRSVLVLAMRKPEC